MLFADARDFAFQQRLRCRETGLGLSRGEHGVDARAVQFQHLAARRLPLRDRLVELGIDGGGLGQLALERQDGAELGHDLGAVLGVVADVQAAVDIERRARQLVGFLVAAFLDQNVGKSKDELGRLRIVLAEHLQPRLQRAAHIDLGFREPALLGLHSPGVEEISVRNRA